MSQDTCMFCKIGAGDISSHKLYEDDDTFAFLDAHPRAPGHTMVIPKHHAATLVELPEELVTPLFETVQKVAGRLQSVLGADGLTIGINQGDVSGQTVKHLHVHIMPRFEGDGGGSIHSVVNSPSDENLEALSDKLKI